MKSFLLGIPQRFIPWIVLAFMLAVSGTLLYAGAIHDAPVMDELAHIPAGYAQIRFLDYRLNPEHPPLLKALAAVPLLFMHVSFPMESVHWSGVNDQWAFGRDFLYHAGNDPQTLVRAARMVPILLTLLLFFFVFWWAQKLMGPWWALAPTFFIAFSPDFLAYGHYVITDVAAALGFFMGMYFFVKMLQHPSKKNVILAGIFFGIAQLFKFSTAFLIPLFLVVGFLYWWAHVHRSGMSLVSVHARHMFWQWVRRLAVIFIIGYGIVSVVYMLFTWGYPLQKQTTDTAQILAPLVHVPITNVWACMGSPLVCLAHVDMWMSSVPLLRGDAQYLLGLIMNLQRFAGTSSAYFLGTVSLHGWWFYFPVLFLAKEPIPILILLYVGLALFISGMTHADIHGASFVDRIERAILAHPGICAMTVTIFLYWTTSLLSTLNIGIRHILPSVPFLYILALWLVRRWFLMSPQAPVAGRGVSVASYGRGIKVVFIIVLAAWLGVEVVATYPYYVSYFNEFAGGVVSGYKIAGDSNYDWGQDLIRLQTLLTTPPLSNEIGPHEKIAVDYFGGGDVQSYGGARMIPWNASKGNPLNEGIHWFVGSIQELELARLSRISSYAYASSDRDYQWLNHIDTPYARAGTSLFIYRLQ